MKHGWRTLLSGLSHPSWRPQPDGGGESSPFSFHKSGDRRIPTEETLERLGIGLVGRWIRWWDAPSKKPISLVGDWEKAGIEAVKELSHQAPTPSEKLQRLVQLAIDQQHPLWVEGDPVLAEPYEVAGSHVRGPRMFIWLELSKNDRNVLEIGLDFDRNRIDSIDREIYLKALEALRIELKKSYQRKSAWLQTSIEIVDPIAAHPNSTQSVETSMACIAELASVLDAARLATMKHIESRLSFLEGVRLDSLQGNQMLAKSLHTLLDRHGLRFRCPECGEPAIMRCLRSGNSSTGSFVFDHYLSQNRTFHGGRSSLPKLVVVGKPARQTSATG